MKNIPQIGQELTVHGLKCKVTTIWPLGTIDVVARDGKSYRITGLYVPGWPKNKIG